MKDRSPTVPAGQRDHLYALLREFDTAMVATRDPTLGYHARPMVIARIEPGGAMYFATRVDTPKVDEVQDEPQALVTVQSRSRFASVTGYARIIRRRDLVEQLWDDRWRAWCDGKDDPLLAFLVVEPHIAEYWDKPGARGVSLVFEAIRSAVTGNRTTSEAHAKLDLH